LYRATIPAFMAKQQIMALRSNVLAFMDAIPLLI
jgi:hypothetical protein